MITKLNSWRKGAIYALTWRAEKTAYCCLAWAYRHVLNRTTFIGITGSAGKTTTKDLSVGILSQFASCSGNRSSFNVPTGIAKGILKTSRTDRYCVLEVAGANPGDMRWPLRMFRPDIAVLTLIEREHVKSAQGLDGVLAEKRKLVAALPSSGIAVLNIDDPLVRSVGDCCSSRVIWIGRSEGATLRLLDASSVWPESLSMKLSYEGREYSFVTGLYGSHLSLSVLAALGKR